MADFSRVLAGPLCTQLLADEGARVIKVEDPRRGDETRRWGPPFLGTVSTYFLSVNRGKESLALDLRSAEGGRLARSLIERADVVIDNFLPAQREELLGDVLAIRPDAVHCSITGYDPDTAEAETPGYDLLAQAGGGLMAITGDPRGEPFKVGVALSDVLTAHYAHGAICAALVARERTGKGARIEVSLFGATVASLVNVGQAVLATGSEAQRYGNAHPSIVPYQLFHASDRPFALGGGTDRHFAELCEHVLGRKDLAADPRFADNASRVAHREVLVPVLQEIFARRKAAEWVRRCRRAAIPCSLVLSPLEALRSDAARPLIGSVGHPVAGTYDAAGNPVRIDGRRLPLGSPPPELGQHTAAIRAELISDRPGRKAARSSRGRTKPGRR